MKNVKYGKCVRCGRTYEAKPDLTNCECGGILDIVYDYDYIRSVLTKEKLARRENRSMWRYRELLPVEETTPDTPLRVGWSPLYEEPKLAELLGIRRLWVKDDGQNPTASLKDRASAMAVAKAYEAGARTIACSSTGNAASSLAGNAAAAGIKTYIFVPERAPKGKVAQLMIFGANVISVKGNYEETFKMSAAAIDKYGWYNRNAAINPYLSEGKKTVALEMLQEVGVEVLLYVFCADVVKNGDAVEGVVIESKAGREAILAKTVIDCTGDGDIAYRAGAPMNYGNEKGIPQPPTLMFSMRGVDSRKLRDAVADHPDVYDIDFIPNEFFRADDNCTFVGFRNQIKKAREAGYKLPVERTIFMTGMAPDEWWVNMSRVNGIDATDPAQYTQGEIICAEQNEEIVRYLKAYIPGFENAYVDRVAPFMGIRETRRIVGEYILTEDDIFNCARFDDVIAVASYPVDLHHPVGGDCSLYWCPDCYDIPYRCLIPQKIDGLIVAGRNVSMTHLALASARVMAPAMALGEAAGKAAALSVKENVELRDLDVRKLQESLKAEGVYFRE